MLKSSITQILNFDFKRKNANIKNMFIFVLHNLRYGTYIRFLNIYDSVNCLHFLSFKVFIIQKFMFCKWKTQITLQ